MVKKGDTLIEVTLAIGIFSMVAISIVAVMASGTSGAQTSLETTLARTEIDAQSEALRFIHSSYITNKTTKDEHYKKIWESITKNALSLDNNNKEVLNYAPKTCDELYSNNGEVYSKNGFIINTHNLGKTNLGVDKVYLLAKGITGSNRIFYQASTYPHIVYGNKYNNNDTSNLSDDSNYGSLYHAEGIYIIAVKETDSDNYNPSVIVDEEGVKKKPAFYDFYIRACWYGANANEPSTISTVIRLYDPESIDNT